jgi:ADP-ribosylglycohydrolase
MSDAIKNEGHMKHAFIFFIFFLKNIDKFTYETAIIEVLKCGGDTDTNAKIVGNLFGAYYGDCVPKYMSDPVLNFDCTQAEGCFKRPEKYGIKNAIRLLGEI